MQEQIETVGIIGANGTIGALTGGLFAQCGFKVVFFSKSLEKSRMGMQRAFRQARSDAIGKNIICSEYSELPGTLPQCDWMIECVKEDIDVKRQIYEMVDKHRRFGSIVSSITSSLPLQTLVEGRSEDLRSHFLGFHLFNPPHKLTLCEIAPIASTHKSIVAAVSKCARIRLFRKVILVRNIPGYVGNRIGFKMFSEITKHVPAFGVGRIDYLLGPYTGRAMSPLATLDLVGLDTHHAIIRSLGNIAGNDHYGAFLFPEYMDIMIRKGHLGTKTPHKGGFYRKEYDHSKTTINVDTLDYSKPVEYKKEFVERAKDLLREGLYRDAFRTILDEQDPEAEFVCKMLCLYVAYSFACMEAIMQKEQSIVPIDNVMRYGFNWAPPSAIVHLFGGKAKIIGYLKRYAMSIPHSLLEYDDRYQFNLGDGCYFCAR